MARFLSPASAPVEQYVNFVAAENIQAGDVAAIGYDDGKIYYLNDPAATNTFGNNLRNFALKSKTSPVTVALPEFNQALPSLGEVGMVKTARLSDGNTLIVFASASFSATAYIPSIALNNSKVGGTLQFVIVNNAGVRQGIAQTLTTTMTACAALSIFASGQHNIGLTSGVDIAVFPAGGFAISWLDIDANNYASLRIGIYSNRGEVAAAQVIVTTVYAVSSYAGSIVAPKMTLLSTGNIVATWGMNRNLIFDASSAAIQLAVYTYMYAIYTPAGVTVKQSSSAGSNWIPSLNNASSNPGAWSSVRHTSICCVAYPNGNFSLMGVRTTYQNGAKERSFICSTFDSVGMLIANTKFLLIAPVWLSGGVGSTSVTEGYALGCLVANGSAMVLTGGYDQSTAYLLSVSSVGVISVLRAGMNASLGGLDLGDGAINGLAHAQWGFLDLAPYGMYPYGEGALLVTSQNEQIISSAGATLSIASSLVSAAGVKPNPIYKASWSMAPQLLTTNLGEVLTLRGFNGAPYLPYVVIENSAFVRPKLIPLQGFNGLVREINSISNSQGTAAKCYSTILWNESGYSVAHTTADAVQGMTFVGVAKAAAVAGSPVSIQVLGQAKLRIPFSKPMIVDTRTVVLPAAVPNASTATSVVLDLVLQANTFGTSATIFGDSAFLKGSAWS